MAAKKSKSTRKPKQPAPRSAPAAAPTRGAERVVRVLLQDGVAVDEVYKFAYRRDYLLHQLGDRRKGLPAEDIWRTIDQRAWLHLVDDTHVQLRYLTIRGGDIDAIAAAAADELPTVEPSTALARLQSASDESNDVVSAIYVLAVAASRLRTKQKQRSEVIAALRRLIVDENRDVRRAVIVGVGYLGWPELRRLLTQLMLDDVDEAVRRDAKLMLDSLATAQD